MGECVGCENVIFSPTIYAERLLGLLDDEAKAGHCAGDEEAAVEYMVEHRAELDLIHWNTFNPVMGTARGIHSGLARSYKGTYEGWQQKDLYGIGKDIVDAAAHIVASLEAYKALHRDQRPHALRSIQRDVENLLGLLRWVQQTPGTEHRESEGTAESRRPATMLEALHRLRPSAFEHVVAQLLRAQGYTGVKIVGGANDRGVDIVCRDTDGSLIAVQCKRYDPNKPGGRVGAPVVQLLSAMALQRRAHRGILVTTATFTDSARKQAHDFDIELIDGEALVQRLSAYPKVLKSAFR